MRLHASDLELYEQTWKASRDLRLESHSHWNVILGLGWKLGSQSSYLIANEGCLIKSQAKSFLHNVNTNDDIVAKFLTG